MRTRSSGIAAGLAAVVMTFASMLALAQNAVAPATTPPPVPSVIGGSQIFSLFAGTLFVLTVIAGIAMLVCMHYRLEGDGEITIRNAFVGFSAALLAALSNEGKANGKNPQVLPPAPGEKKE